MECESKSDTGNNGGDWNHFKVTKKIPKQSMGKHEIKELQKNSHIGQCIQTAGSANVKVQNIFHGRNNITCSTHCKYRTAATL